MTTRITLAILLTTWVVLIIGEAGAFVIARQSLTVVLDDALITRANNMLEKQVREAQADGMTNPMGDHYIIRDETTGAELAQSEPRTHPPLHPVVISRHFASGIDGERVREVTLRYYDLRDGKRLPITVTYSRPSRLFDGLLSQLAVMLLMISLACGLTTAWLALKLSRAALRPLRETAETIAGIDESRLARRIDAEVLPIELQAMTERLNEMLARLEHVFKQRKQFLADAAHELRTPTAALLTTLELAVRRPRDQAALVDALRSGLADARRLRKLVENLMEHARGEHARGPEALQPADLSALFTDCVQVVQPLAAAKHITLEQDVPPALEFVTEPDRLRSIVLNVLSNAIEYNREGGGVLLTCRTANGSIELSVQDTGRGIADAQLPQVFEPFYRGGQSHEDRDAAGHLGLGLFLVRSHTAALGGECHIQSQLGQGTLVRITLPVRPAGAAPEPAQAPEPVAV
jgi:signal transduction histidine kinase